jgi:hypothetical protein
VPVYAATIFLSAFLLFQVQPLIAKFILPWFGGSAAVWSAALLFFQLLLLAGYLYAHCVIRYLKPKQQFWVHGSLLILSLATLPIVPSATWKPSGGDDPTLRILLLLGATIGLPYGLLSATSPLLQAWYLRTHQGAIPYRLFALSNFGSMLALLSYPLVIEPRLALSRQALVWSIAYCVFAAACAFAAWRSRSGETPESSSADAPAPTLAQRALWIGFAACASTLLLAVSSHLTQNIAPIPLLWVAPLSLYLLSFILCFESDRMYNRAIFLPLLIVSLYLLTRGIGWYENNAEPSRLIPALCGALFVCCMVCHGELARRRPHPRYLTQFYLMVSVGGAIGGLFVALAAPRLFNSYYELPVAMVLCAFLVTCVLWIDMPSTWLRAATVLATIAFAVILIRIEVADARLYTVSARNFYGVLRVLDQPEGKYSPAERLLIHGVEAPRRRPHPDLLFRHRLRHQSRHSHPGPARADSHRRPWPRRRGHRDPRPLRRYAALLRNQSPGGPHRAIRVRILERLSSPKASLPGRRPPGSGSHARRAPGPSRHGRFFERRRSRASSRGGGLPHLPAPSQSQRHPGHQYYEPLLKSGARGRPSRPGQWLPGHRGGRRRRG